DGVVISVPKDAAFLEGIGTPRACIVRNIGFVGGRESEVAERTAQFVVLPADIAVYFIGASGSAPVDGAGFEFGEFSNNRGPIFDTTLSGSGISPLGAAAHSKQPRKDAAMHLMGLRCA